MYYLRISVKCIIEGVNNFLFLMTITCLNVTHFIIYSISTTTSILYLNQLNKGALEEMKQWHLQRLHIFLYYRITLSKKNFSKYIGCFIRIFISDTAVDVACYNSFELVFVYFSFEIWIMSWCFAINCWIMQ